MNKKTSFLLLPALLAAALLSPMSPAVAASTELPAGLGCDFALRIDSTGGKLHEKTFTDKDGDPVRFLSAGKGVVLTYTNIDSGESVTIRTDGSVTSIRFNADGTQTWTTTGHNGLILFPSDVPAGPTTTQYVGKVVFNVDPTTGIFTLVSTKGQARDICAELS
jgi:WD40 repeat protein